MNTGVKLFHKIILYVSGDASLTRIEGKNNQHNLVESDGTKNTEKK